MSDLVAAFPGVLRADAAAVVGVMPQAEHPPVSAFAVRVHGETVFIPYRMYHPEPNAAAVGRLSPLRRSILACLYTRHHDGFVRQRYLGLAGELARDWVAPFVVKLVGEYVVQIVLDLRDRLAGVDLARSALRATYGRFAAENTEFVDLVFQRAVSYWDCYYRGWYVRRQDYPAFEILRSVREAGREIERTPG